MIENKLLFDKRVIKRNLKRGLITEAEYEQHVQGLTDLEENAEEIEVEIEEDEYDLRPTQGAAMDFDDDDKFEINE